MLSLMLCTILLLPIFAIFSNPCVAETPNCCSLNETQLEALPGNPSCPSDIGSELEVLTAKCDQCPEGTCRVNLACFCSTDFLANDDHKQLCEYSFGENWPRSVGKEDTTYRSCAKEPSSTTTDDNCCLLTTNQLESRIGTSHSCPLGSTSIYSDVKELGAKCDRCPFGTCRVGRQCFCPKDFFQSEDQQELCRPSFGEKWEESVGLEDRHWRSCVRPTPSESFTFDSCCLLSAEQLEIRVGTSIFCPTFSTSVYGGVKDLDDQCDPCPFGTCRAGSSCYCPQDFFDSDSQKELCRESFGEVYPDSVGLPDTLCPSNPLPKELSLPPKPTPKPVQSQNSNPTASEAPSKPSNTSSVSTPPDSTSSGADKSSDTSNSNPSKVASNAPADMETDESGESNLSTAEIAGIVIGSVTGIISALGVVVAWWFDYLPKRGKEEERDLNVDEEQVVTE